MPKQPLRVEYRCVPATEAERADAYHRLLEVLAGLVDSPAVQSAGPEPACPDPSASGEGAQAPAPR